MRKFLAVGHHGPVDPELGLRIADVAVDWISAKLADGTFDCLYSMAGGGRLIVANVADEETLLEMLRAAPDAPREWTLTELFDGIEVIRNYVASMRP
ncbi:hypothetical protein ACFO1B_52265 [Dactylosporangium siamense]|uniref:Muconolactone isomerase domain-containing protein n=1 Tax=Dactylosporangium siamense TaxID=685454 RepID=A0A919UHM7_9ACTN|nr:hypothetical protein [Dactylosporangium siamense]GIG52556.1 hypothetical protein Dsi01nite_105970 [Dactylosporangium siamense]